MNEMEGWRDARKRSYVSRQARCFSSCIMSTRTCKAGCCEKGQIVEDPLESSRHKGGSREYKNSQSGKSFAKQLPVVNA